MSQQKPQKAPKAPQKGRTKTLSIPLKEPLAGVLHAAAKAEGESIEEYALGAGYMSLAADLKVLEAFLGGFPLSVADVQRINRLVAVRKAAAVVRKSVMGGMTHFLELKRIRHEEHVRAERDREIADVAQRLGLAQAS